MRIRGLIALVAAALVVAGCGGGGGEDVSSTGAGPASASIAPASTELFISLLTDFESGQWKSLEALAERFPSVKAALEDPEFVNGRDAFGPDTGVVALTLEDSQQSAFVGFNQPRDEAKFRTLLEQEDEPSVVEEIEGWQVFANTRDTLDRFKAARNDASLADDENFQAAMAALPATRLLTVFVPGAPIADAFEDATQATSDRVPGIGSIGWLAAAAHVRDEGIAVDFRIKGDDVNAQPFTATLLEEVPAGALAYVSFRGVVQTLEELKNNPSLREQLDTAQFLGETFDKVLALFANEGVLYVRPGVPIPEVTLAFAVDDEAAAIATVDELLTKMAPFTPGQTSRVDIGGLSVRKVTLENNVVYAAAFDGKLVVTSSEAGITGLRDGGATLTDDAIYTAATDGAEVPDETAGSLYVNLPAILPLLTALSPENPATREALAQAGLLGPIVAYAQVEEDVVSARLFLSVE